MAGLRLEMGRMYRNGLLELVWPRVESPLDREAILKAGLLLCVAYAAIGYVSYWLQGRATAGLVLGVFFAVVGVAIRGRALAGPIYLVGFLWVAVILCLVSPFGAGVGTLFLALAALPGVGAARAIRAGGAAGGGRGMRALRGMLLAGLFAGACGVVVFGTLCGLFEVEASDASMLPTIAPGSWLVGVNLRAGERLFRSELVVGTMGTARVAGLPGDCVRIQAGRLIVNGAPVREPYTRVYTAGDGDFPLPSAAYANDGERWAHDFAYGSSYRDRPYCIPDGEYFLLNDNRSDLGDSRTRGPFPRGDVIARLRLEYERGGVGWRWLR